MKEKEEDEENKIRKFAYREQTIKQTENNQSMNSKTEATLILCGSSGERANKYLSLSVSFLMHLKEVVKQ